MRYAQARISRVQARMLAFIRDQKAYHKLGFSCFGDMTRMFQLAPRTAQEHVLLHRLLDGKPQAEEAFRLGSLSLHQVLALAPVLCRGDLAPHDRVDWVDVARELTVAQLRRRVREFAGAEAEQTEDDGRSAASSPVNASSPSAPPTSILLDPILEDPRGRMISFTSPLPAASAWDAAIELARCVLGWNAPAYSCVEAILVEASPQTAQAEADPLRKLYGVGGGARIPEDQVLSALRSPARFDGFRSLPQMREAHLSLRQPVLTNRPALSIQPAPTIRPALTTQPTSPTRPTPTTRAASTNRPTPTIPRTLSLPRITERTRQKARNTLDLIERLLRALSTLEEAAEPASPREAAHRLRDL